MNDEDNGDSQNGKRRLRVTDIRRCAGVLKINLRTIKSSRGPGGGEDVVDTKVYVLLREGVLAC